MWRHRPLRVTTARQIAEAFGSESILVVPSEMAAALVLERLDQTVAYDCLIALGGTLSPDLLTVP